MAERKNRVTAAAAKVAKVFDQQPDRVAAAWRRVRFSECPKGQVPDNLLDDVVENFVREIGAKLAGAKGSPWSRTRGVLRIAPERGVQALFEEFHALRRCLFDAAEVLGGTPSERAIISAAVDEAVESSAALYGALTDPLAFNLTVPFGGLVVEYFERAAAMATPRPHAPAVATH